MPYSVFDRVGGGGGGDCRSTFKQSSGNMTIIIIVVVVIVVCKQVPKLSYRFIIKNIYKKSINRLKENEEVYEDPKKMC